MRRAHGAPGLTIVGCGIRGPQQITVEGLSAAAEAGRVLSLSVDPAELFPFLESRGVREATSLDHLYLDGAIDADNYDRIRHAVINEIEANGSVCLIMYGHPRVGVSLVGGLERILAARGLEVEVIAAPSSFDAMINDLARDPLERGTLIVDANRLLLFDIRLDPTTDCFVYHVCSVGAPQTDYSDPSRSTRLDLLQQHLQRYYPDDHPAVLIDSAERGTDRGRMLRFPLNALVTQSRNVRFSSTLFLEAGPPRAVNDTFLELLRHAGARPESGPAPDSPGTADA